MIKKVKIISNLSFSKVFLVIVSVLMTLVLGGISYKVYENSSRMKLKIADLSSQLKSLQAELEVAKREYTEIFNQDQAAANRELKAEITNLQKGYDLAAKIYSDILDFRDRGGKTIKLEEQLAKAISLLSDKKYTDAVAELNKLSANLAAEVQKAAAAVVIPANVPVSNDAPSAGYSRQQVATSIGNFMVSMVAGDLSNTKILVDTASDNNCGNDCPVLPLATYVSRSGAYAGINGSYFCPSTYPDCQSKKNSFDLLLMNKNKVYFNSDNNVYSTNPGVVFGGSYIRFMTAVSQWGRDTGIDGMISNYPLLLMNSQITFGGNRDPKQGSKGNRSFVASKGNQVYIGVVHGATVAESAVVLKALGMDNGLNLDNGGSTALWSGGYRVGPGRDIPNAILFVRK